MKTLLASVIILSTAVILSCESPLSDTQVTDPGILQPVVQVTRDIQSNGTLSYSYRCDVYDKNTYFVELKDGGVKLNGESLLLVHDLLGPYYLTDNLHVPYSLATKYTFTITLADQSSYEAVVTTPKLDFIEFVAPEVQSSKLPMHVSWGAADSNSVMSMIVTKHFRTDTSSGIAIHKVAIGNPLLRSYDLQPADFVHEEGTTYGVELTLTSQLEGTIDPKFYFGSRAYSSQTITRSVKIN